MRLFFCDFQIPWADQHRGCELKEPFRHQLFPKLSLSLFSWLTTMKKFKPTIIILTYIAFLVRIATSNSRNESLIFPLRIPSVIKEFYQEKEGISTVFENHPKCRIWIFDFWYFLPIFVLLKLTCLVTLFDRKLQVFKNSPKWTIFGLFNELLSTQNVNVARFARNVEWDFFCDFRTPCHSWEKSPFWCHFIFFAFTRISISTIVRVCKHTSKLK